MLAPLVSRPNLHTYHNGLLYDTVEIVGSGETANEGPNEEKSSATVDVEGIASDDGVEPEREVSRGRSSGRVTVGEGPNERE